jgi:photosystem II stability/assembly factor-like uncharacterized protein
LVVGIRPFFFFPSLLGSTVPTVKYSNHVINSIRLNEIASPFANMVPSAVKSFLILFVLCRHCIFSNPTVQPSFAPMEYSDNWIKYSPSLVYDWSSIALSMSGQYGVASSNGFKLFYSNSYGISWIPSSKTGVQNFTHVAICSTGQYAVAASSIFSLYYSNNFGHTWLQSNADERSWYNVAISSSGQYVLAVGGNVSTILYSNDYGVTYKTSSSTMQSWKAVAMDASGQYAIAASSSSTASIWYCSTFGTTWAQSSISISTTWTSVCMSSSGKYAIAASSSQANGGIYYSRDFGYSWAPSNAIMSSWNSLACTSSGQVVAAASTSSYYMHYSSDYGITWTASSSAGSLVDWRSVAINGDGRYMVGTKIGKEGIYSNNRAFSPSPTMSPSFISELPETVVSPTASPTILPTPDTVAPTVQAGEWQAASGLPTGASYFLSVAMSDSGQFAVAGTNARQLWYSDNYGVSWTLSAPSSLVVIVYQIAMSSSGQFSVAACSGPNIVYISEDYGHSWRASGVSKVALYTGAVLSAAGDNILVSSLPGMFMLRSTDYGLSFFPVVAPQLSWKFLSMSASGQYAVSLVHLGNVYHSSDYGASWVPSTIAGAYSWNYPSMDATGKYVTVSASGIGLFYSSDFGHTWIKASAPKLNWYGLDASASGQYLIASPTNGYIHYSDDFGHTWKASDSAGFTSGWRAAAISADGKYLLVTKYTGNSIYYTSDAFASASVVLTVDALCAQYTTSNTNVAFTDSISFTDLEMGTAAVTLTSVLDTVLILANFDHEQTSSPPSSGIYSLFRDSTNMHPNGLQIISTLTTGDVESSTMTFLDLVGAAGSFSYSLRAKNSGSTGPSTRQLVAIRIPASSYPSYAVQSSASFTLSSTTFVHIGLILNVTTTSTMNKVLLAVTLNVRQISMGLSDFVIYRNDAQIDQIDFFQRIIHKSSSSTTWSVTIVFLDEPGSIGVAKYSVLGRAVEGSCEIGAVSQIRQLSAVVLPPYYVTSRAIASISNSKQFISPIWTGIGLNSSIVPRAETDSVLILLNLNLLWDSPPISCMVTVFRGATNLGDPVNGLHRVIENGGSAGSSRAASITFVDSPRFSNGTALLYSVQVRLVTGTSMYVPSTGFTSILSLMLLNSSSQLTEHPTFMPTQIPTQVPGSPPQTLLPTVAPTLREIGWTTSAGAPAINFYWSSSAMSASGQYALAVADGNSGIWCSNTYGKIWDISNSVTGSWRYVVMSSSGRYAVAVGSIILNIYFSSDYGRNWLPSGVLPSSWDQASMSSSGQYVAAHNSISQVFRSDDYGHTFEQLFAAPLLYAVTIDGSGAHWVGGHSSSIYHSKDYGNTWIRSPFTVAIPWGLFCVSKSGQFVVAAPATTANLFYSSDYGHTWMYTDTSSHIWNALAMSESGQYVIAAYYGGNIYASSDYGHTWKLSAGSPVETWRSVSINGDGNRMIALTYISYIYYNEYIFSPSPTRSPNAVPSDFSLTFQVMTTSSMASFFSPTSAIDIGLASTVEINYLTDKVLILVNLDYKSVAPPSGAAMVGWFDLYEDGSKLSIGHTQTAVTAFEGESQAASMVFMVQPAAIGFQTYSVRAGGYGTVGTATRQLTTIVIPVSYNCVCSQPKICFSSVYLCVCKSKYGRNSLCLIQL